MDPVTHFLVGTGIAELSGEKISFTNPIYLATIIGALAPDLDAVFQFRGHIAYLKNHRGISHSIPGLVLGSALISLVLHLVFPEYSLSVLYFWALMGSFSHSLLDVLNSYGAQLLWPFTRRKISLNLLVLFDPIVVGLFLSTLFWPGTPRQAALTALGILTVYLVFRLYMRHSVYLYLREKYRDQDIRRVIVMPAMISLWSWSFLVETGSNYIVGEAKWLSFRTGIKRVLEKAPYNTVVNTALHSHIGRLFQNFTPYYHIHCYQDGDNHVVCFADLRYFVRDDFLHNATVVLSKENEITEAVFQPYNKNHKLSF